MEDNVFLKPDEVLEEWDVRPGERIADFGAGAGYFALPLGKRVGANGKVYAIDIRPEALEATRAKAKLFHMFNIEPLRADLELERGSTLKDSSVDKVLIANILFQAENKEVLAEEAFRILRPGGTLLVIEWAGESAPAGPSLDARVDQSEAEEIFKGAGFSLAKTLPAGSHHYGLVFSKK